MSKKRVQLKDRILDNVAKAIKEVQRFYCSQDTDDVSPITDEDRPFQTLVEHIDHAFLHGLRVITAGYWGMVQKFTHKDIISDITALNCLATDFGRGRAWLYLALKETSLESYIRCILDNPKLVQSYYHGDAILRDKQRLILLQTLVSGLDFVQFDPELNNAYLDLVSHMPRSATKFEQQTEDNDFNDDTDSVGSSESASIHTNVTENTEKENLTSEMKSIECSGETVVNDDTLETASTPEDDTSIAASQEILIASSRDMSDEATKQTNVGIEISFQLYENPLEKAKESQANEKLKQSLDVLLGQSDSSLERPDNLTIPQRTSGQESIADDNLEVIHIFEKKSRKGKRKKNRTSKTTIPPKMNREKDESWSLNSEEGTVSITSEDSWSSTHGTPMSYNENHSFSLGESICPEDLLNNSSLTRSENPSPSLIKASPKDDNILAGHLTSPSVIVPEESKRKSPSMNLQDADTEGVCNIIYVPDVKNVLPRKFSKDPSRTNEKCASDETSHGQDNKSRDIDFKKEFEHQLGDYLSHNQKTEVNGCNAVIYVNDVETDGGFCQEQQLKPDGTDTSFEEVVETSLLQDVDKSLQDGSYESLFASPVAQKLDEADKPSLKSSESAASSLCPEGSSMSQSFSDKESLQDSVSRASIDNGSSVLEPGVENSKCEGSESTQDIYPASTSISVSMQPEPDIEMKLDNNSKLFLMLEVFKNESEEFKRMFHLNTGHEEGDLQPVFILLSDQALYLLRKGDSDLAYTTEVRVQYNDLDYISVSLNYQIIQIVCVNRRKQYWVSNGAESSTRYFLDELKQVMKGGSRTKGLPSVLTDATTQKIALRKFVAQQCRCEMADVQILLYSLIHWEDLTDSLAAPDLQLYRSPVVMEGKLDYKVPGSALFYAYWKPCYCLLKHDTFHKFAQKEDLEPELSVQLGSNRFGGCRRVRNGDRQYAFELILNEGTSLQVSCESEKEVSDWLQTICTIVAQSMTAKIEGRTPTPCQPCCLVVCDTKLLLCHEDCQTQFYRSLASCNICDIASLAVDDQQQSYAMIKFEVEESENPWVLYFTSAAEKQKFELAVGEGWQKLKQDVLPILPINNEKVKQRCQECFILIQSSWQRSDSLLRGRIGGNIW